MSRCSRTFLVCALALCPALVRAQNGGQDSPLTGSQGVRALGMGGAVSSWLDEPAAVWWNPATLTFAPVRRLELQHTKNAFDTRTEQFALVFPTLDYGAWSLAGALQTTTDVIVTGPLSPAPLSTESFNRFQLAAGYGLVVPYDMKAGFALNVAGYRFMGLQRVAWGLDVGLVPYATAGFKTALVVHNLLRPTFSFADNLEDKWSRRAVVGASFAKAGAMVSGEAEFSDQEDARFRLGAEYRVAEPLMLRAGYDGFGPTVGASVRYKRLRVDYAYLSPSDLGTEHRIGLTLDIGRPIDVQRELRAQRIDFEVADALEAQKVAQRPELEARADSAMTSGAWAQATRSYAQLLFLFPEEEKYEEGLQSIAARRDSSLQADIAAAIASADRAGRTEALTALAEEQMQARNWTATLATTRALNVYPDSLGRAAELEALASDSLTAAINDALGRSRSAMADSNAVEAAGWARTALLLDSTQTDAQGILAQAERMGRRRQLESSLLEAAAGADTAQVRSLAQELIALEPDHSLAQRYLDLYGARRVPTVSIEELQQDAEAWEWYTQGFVEFRSGQYDEAIRSWEKVSARYPGNEDTMKNLEQARLRIQSPGDE
jgi:hypothetical protein